MSLFFSFDGRIGRARFWIGNIVAFLVFVAFYVLIIWSLGLNVSVNTNNNGVRTFAGDTRPLYYLAAAYLVFLFISFALVVKRLHDRGKTGSWAWIYAIAILTSPLQFLYPEWIIPISLVGLAASLWWLVDLGILEGQRGPNTWGPSQV